MAPPRCPTMLRPSAWVTRFAPLIRQGGEVLDLACGGGRHTAWLLLNSWSVTAVDEDVSAVEPLVGMPRLTVEARDLEGEEWPWGEAVFDGIVVTNYLYRPHFEHYWASLKEGGIFISETFLRANRDIWGRPARDEHSWVEGEILSYIPKGARIIALEQGLTKRELAYARVVFAKPSSVEPLVYNLNAE
ncbi:MAG: methyltransferase domain-containing protein [Sutterella wadsworthensis]|nr:methyltransferase domain-containing protein [Sutterella wadsworthensis]